jgi:sirohydrochlorin cobaltochelatase
MKIGILIVSFGTTYPETRKKNITKIKECVRECYPDALIREAVSSDIVRKLMQKNEHLPVMDTAEALALLHEEGATHVAVMPTHVIDGIENSKMKQAVEDCRFLFADIQVADPLLTDPSDYARTAKALWESVKDEAGDDPVIFMGHGTAHEADASYRTMEQALRDYAHHPIYMATVEGSVTIEDVIARLRQEVPAGRVILTPFMLVAGDHAENDMAGEEESFASSLAQEGYQPECLIRGIGEYPAIREIYLAHLRSAVNLLTHAADSARTPQGKLYGIGVGPGDPELITLKAVRVIKACDILVLPAVSKEVCYAYRIAVCAVPEIEKKPAYCMPFPMISDEGKLAVAHQEIYHAIAEELQQGKTVGLLTIGDPSVYSTYMYMHHRAVENGYAAEMVSGVPSFCAAAARLGISLGEKKEEIHMIPGSCPVEDTLALKGTRIYMKSGKHLQHLLRVLEANQNTDNSYEIYAVSNCGMDNEKVYRGLEAAKEAEGYLTIVIVKES